ncbi:MAG: carbonic anhydrase [Armatimonadetes bacterium]|nr:carbonic anhydrase [Armatimonadota bacterium]
MTDDAKASLDVLLAGNERFRNGKSTRETYSLAQLQEIAKGQKPLAAIVACSDSRVAPEVVFDQPLGTVFAARTPGNVSADSVKWMIEIAVDELKVPLLLVIGHTGCLAVTQIVEGQASGPGGMLRHQISAALTRARSVNKDDVMYQTIIENVYQTISKLREESYELKKAIANGTTSIIGAVYDMESGRVDILEQRERTL